MQAIHIINIYAKYIEKINSRLFDKIILINLHTISDIYANMINKNYDYIIFPIHTGSLSKKVFSAVVRMVLFSVKLGLLFF